MPGGVHMNQNVELLEFIYQNTQMGLLTIPRILEKTTDEELKTLLNAQLKEYEEINACAKEYLLTEDTKPKSVSEMAKMSSTMMTQMKTMMDSSPSNIAEMMIDGNTMGVIEIIKKIHKYKDLAKPEYIKLAEKLQKTEEANVSQMKAFL